MNNHDLSLQKFNINTIKRKLKRFKNFFFTKKQEFLN